MSLSLSAQTIRCNIQYAGKWYTRCFESLKPCRNDGKPFLFTSSQRRGHYFDTMATEYPSRTKRVSKPFSPLTIIWRTTNNNEKPTVRVLDERDDKCPSFFRYDVNDARVVSLGLETANYPADVVPVNFTSVTSWWTTFFKLKNAWSKHTRNYVRRGHSVKSRTSGADRSGIRETENDERSSSRAVLMTVSFFVRRYR